MNEILYELKSDVELKKYFLRSAWIFLIYIALVTMLKVNEIQILSYIPNENNVDMSGIYNIFCIFLFIVTFIIYLKVVVTSYKRNKGRKCTFYDNMLVYENEYAIMKTKDVTYENINKIVIEKNILDKIFKTGTIRIHKAVEYDEGMAIKMLKDANKEINKIQEIVKRKY